VKEKVKAAHESEVREEVEEDMRYE